MKFCAECMKTCRMADRGTHRDESWEDAVACSVRKELQDHESLLIGAPPYLIKYSPKLHIAWLALRQFSNVSTS